MDFFFLKLTPSTLVVYKQVIVRQIICNVLVCPTDEFTLSSVLALSSTLYPNFSSIRIFTVLEWTWILYAANTQTLSVFLF